MSRSRDLERLPAYVPPPVPRGPLCGDGHRHDVAHGCGVNRPAVLVPIGDGAIEMCWLCAHLVTEHDVAPTRVALMRAMEKPRAGCVHARDAIYPADVNAAIDRSGSARIDAGQRKSA